MPTMTETRPCPDCAHTENPGCYVGFDFIRETCRTCGGATTVPVEPTAGGCVESVTIDGVEFRPNTDGNVELTLEDFGQTYVFEQAPSSITFNTVTGFAQALWEFENG